MRRWVALLAALLLTAQSAPPLPPPVEAPAVIARFPHDTHAYTEGLFWHDGGFYESTGERGTSSIRRVDLASGRIVRRVELPSSDFGEGIVAVGNQIVSLTWQQQLGYRWDLGSFRRIGTWHYPGEGWALTTDGRQLIMSDGTADLRFLDPRTLRERGRIRVTANGRPIDQLNELEYVDGEVLANIWQTNLIARIDPATGHVLGFLDLTALAREVGATDPNAVLNGIAWDAQHRRLFVTGKYWPTMFQIAWPRRR